MEFQLRTFAGKRVCPLGLSATYRPGRKTIHAALDAGVNLFFCFGFDGQMTSALRGILPGRREDYVVVTGAYHLIWTSLNLRRALEKRLRQLRTDYIDAFLLLGIPRRRHFTGRMRDEIAQLRADSRVRPVGVSTHDRGLAADLAATGVVDTLMIRYNAAHPGAECDVFPHLDGRRTDVLSYTATCWTRLIRRGRGWPGGEAIPTAAQCYRFALTNPQVNACLTAPANPRQFRENIEALRTGPLAEDEMDLMRRYGDYLQRRGGWFM